MAASTGTAHAAGATSNGEAVIVSRLSFFAVEDLEFGSIIRGTTSGTVTITPAGARSSTGGVTLASGGLVQAARFAGRGTVGQTVTISMLATPINITRIGGTETMQVGTFVIGSTPTVVLTTTPLSFVIGSATGIFNFPVGATLTVNPNQADGNYQGTFSIILNYM